MSDIPMMKGATPPANSTPIMDTVKKFFKEDDWPTQELEGRPAIRTGFKGDNGQFTCVAYAYDDRNEFVFYSYHPDNCPENKRQAMAEYLTRANYGLYIGNFEMDFSDGEIRYKTSIDVKDDRLTTALVKSLVYANVLLMDRYLPGILAILNNEGAVPADEIKKIEG